MSKEIAVFLCDRTGYMAEPWAEADVECYCIDIQHSIRRERVADRIHFVWGDVRTWRPPVKSRIVFLAAFPPCTDVANCGARDLSTKGSALLRDALELFEACRMAGAWSGAPYMIENPVGVLSSIPHIGKPDFYFHPWEFAGYCHEDNYTKKTCLWTGNGFEMPEPRHAPELGEPDDRIHKATPSDGRADFRSATPRGFARAVFDVNAPIALRTSIPEPARFGDHGSPLERSTTE